MTEKRPRIGRKLIVDAKPNRLFLQYLEKWRDEAAEKGDKSSYTYGKAYKSLKKYPLPLQCGEEAKILENFGDKICKMLDTQLAKDGEEQGMSPGEFLEHSRKVPASWWDKVNKEAPVATKKPTKRKKPAEKGHDQKPDKKKQITITEMLIPASESQPCEKKDEEKELLASARSAECIKLLPGQFAVVLCVDTRETMGETKRKEMGQELNKQNVLYEQRTLQIGDFLWIAQEKPEFCKGNPPKELVLDYIIERKILSDLAMSIRDGRFHEQKIRLKQSGLGNIIYLIENMGSIENQSLPEQTLRQAAYNTQIVDHICVKYTKNVKATVKYLSLMTQKLERLYRDCTLVSGELEKPENVPTGTHNLIPFTDFNEMGSKQRKLTTTEMFTRQLMQIHGVSHDKAASVTALYPTPISLINRYKSLATHKQKEELLSTIKFGLAQRNLGIAVSRTIKTLFS